MSLGASATVCLEEACIVRLQRHDVVRKINAQRVFTVPFDVNLLQCVQKCDMRFKTRRDASVSVAVAHTQQLWMFVFSIWCRSHVYMCDVDEQQHILQQNTLTQE